MLFKGPGPFAKFFFIGGNVDELKACRLIPLTPPPPLFSFYTTYKIYKRRSPISNIIDNPFWASCLVVLGEERYIFNFFRSDSGSGTSKDVLAIKAGYDIEEGKCRLADRKISKDVLQCTVLYSILGAQFCSKGNILRRKNLRGGGGVFP
jgi:hypothetical protein